MNTKHRLMTIGGLALSVGSVVAGSAITSGAIGGTDPTPDRITVTSITDDPDGSGMISCTSEIDADVLPIPAPGAAAGGGTNAAVAIAGAAVDPGVAPPETVVGAGGAPSFDVNTAGGDHVVSSAEGDLAAIGVTSVSVGADGVPVFSGDVREGTPEECSAVELPEIVTTPTDAPDPSTEG